MDTLDSAKPTSTMSYTAAEIGAIAHLYRGEVYRSTSWRSRLDNTTNWAVATLGIALSVTFASREASPLPLLLVGWLAVVFLVFEARRYRYFNVWRARARWMETHFYAPMLRGEGTPVADRWNETLAHDYCRPRHHISMPIAIGRRLRRTYIWIFAIQGIAYFGKIAIHPSPMTGFADLFARATVGPLPGELMLAGGLLFNVGWLIFAVLTLRLDRSRRKTQRSSVAMG